MLTLKLKNGCNCNRCRSSIFYFSHQDLSSLYFISLCWYFLSVLAPVLTVNVRHIFSSHSEHICIFMLQKVFSGNGTYGRLGIGSTDSVSMPNLLKSIQHITITRIAVHSTGKHCLALSQDGEVTMVFSFTLSRNGKSYLKSCTIALPYRSSVSVCQFVCMFSFCSGIQLGRRRWWQAGPRFQKQPGPTPSYWGSKRETGNWNWNFHLQHLILKYWYCAL